MPTLLLTAYFQLPEQHRAAVLAMFEDAEILSTLTDEIPVTVRDGLRIGPLIASEGDDPSKDRETLRLDVIRLQAEGDVEDDAHARTVVEQVARRLRARLASYGPSWVSVRGYVVP